jgi:hypothetical protein
MIVVGVTTPARHGYTKGARMASAPLSRGRWMQAGWGVWSFDRGCSIHGMRWRRLSAADPATAPVGRPTNGWSMVGWCAVSTAISGGGAASDGMLAPLRLHARRGRHNMRMCCWADGASIEDPSMSETIPGERRMMKGRRLRDAVLLLCDQSALIHAYKFMWSILLWYCTHHGISGRFCSVIVAFEMCWVVLLVLAWELIFPIPPRVVPPVTLSYPPCS